MSTVRYNSLFTRLVSNIDEPQNDQSCWEWRGNKDHRGYGRLSVRVPGKKNPTGVRAHRLMYEIIHDVKLTPDQEVGHLCVNPACINFDHFELVTKTENLKRQWERRRSNHA